MLVKNVSGEWYDIEEAKLQSHKVDRAKAQEALVAERAEKRKKILDLAKGLDTDEIEMLYTELLGRMQGRSGAAGTLAQVANVVPDCSSPDCADCREPRSAYYSAASSMVPPSINPGRWVSARPAILDRRHWCTGSSGGCPECHCPECKCPECVSNPATGWVKTW